jgi:hypothetical protein
MDVVDGSGNTIGGFENRIGGSNEFIRIRGPLTFVNKDVVVPAGITSPGAGSMGSITRFASWNNPDWTLIRILETRVTCS